MKQILGFVVFFIVVSPITVPSLDAQSVDATIWWLIVSPDADTRSRSNLDSLGNLLKERGKVRRTTSAASKAASARTKVSRLS